MNGELICQNVAGVAGECRGVALEPGLVRIAEIRLSRTAHLLFISGKTIASFLRDAVLKLPDGQRILLHGTPQLQIPCHSWELPYRLTDALFVLETKEEK